MFDEEDFFLMKVTCRSDIRLVALAFKPDGS